MPDAREKHYYISRNTFDIYEKKLVVFFQKHYELFFQTSLYIQEVSKAKFHNTAKLLKYNIFM